MKSVLVVDDKDENLYLLQVLLTHQGYRVSTARHGAEALTMARQSPPDLLVTDILMPVMDGFALCRQWKSDAQLKHIPLIFYTATYTDARDERFALDLGADAFVVKPAEPAAFMAIIQAVLAATGEATAPARETTVDEPVLLKEYNQVLVHKLEKKLLQLEEAEQYNRMLFDVVPDGILIADGDGICRDANANTCRMLGHAREQLLGLPLADVVAKPGFDAVEMARAAIEGQAPRVYQWPFRRADGSQFAADVRVATMPDGQLLVSIRDLTEGQVAAARIQRLTQLYAALSQCNQAIVRCTNEEQLFPQVCRDAVRFGGMKLAWIGLLDPASRQVKTVAAFGDGAEYLEGLGVSVNPDDRFGRGPTGTSIRNGQPFWCQDFLDDPATAPWHQRGLQLGWRSSAALPLFRSGVPVGALSLYAATVNAFDDDARKLLVEMAADISFALDNFARERARQRAEAERQKYETIVKTAGWGMVIADPDTHVMAFVNPAFERMHGYAPGEMAGLSLADTFAPESRAELPAHVLSVHQKGYHTYESMHLRQDGSTFPCQTDVTAFKDSDGRVLFRAATFEDITERKRSEQALQDSERRLRELIDGLGPSLFVGLTTLDGVILEANRPALEAAHLTLADVLGKRVEETYWFAYSDEVQRRVREAIRRASQGEPSRYDERIRAADDQFVDIDFSVLPLCNASGEVVFVIPSASVITERKRFEEEIQTLNAELELRVERRTAQLVAANRELDSFTYLVSHDLKAPLRGIEGYGCLLEERYRDQLDDEGQAFLHNIREGASHMHRLIDDLLDYSRMERRGLTTSMVDLPACVAAVTAEYADEIAAHGVVLRAEVPMLEVSVDRDGLVIVLRNLIDNALKFSRGARPPVIEIAARREDNKVILWVRDNGIGFDMRFQQRIFEVFSRLQRAEEYPGTGVGLALVHKAMQRMGGRVWAESAPAQGATFFLEIPE